MLVLEIGVHFGFKVQNLFDFDVVQEAFVHREQRSAHQADGLWAVLGLLEQFCDAGTGERIEITHKSSSRATYAQGSLRAVRFLADQKTGLFDMFDVLSLR